MADKIREIRKEEFLSWSLGDYVKDYRPWSENADHGEKIAEVYGGVYIRPDDAKNILEAYERGDKILTDPLEIKRIMLQGGDVTIAGKKYGWPIARAVVSFFQDKKHLTYLDKYDLSNIKVV